jgi:hypothetical protein
VSELISKLLLLFYCLIENMYPVFNKFTYFFHVLLSEIIIIIIIINVTYRPVAGQRTCDPATHYSTQQ